MVGILELCLELGIQSTTFLTAVLVLTLFLLIGKVLFGPTSNPLAPAVQENLQTPTTLLLARALHRLQLNALHTRLVDHQAAFDLVALEGRDLAEVVQLLTADNQCLTQQLSYQATATQQRKRANQAIKLLSSASSLPRHMVSALRQWREYAVSQYHLRLQGITVSQALSKMSSCHKIAMQTLMSLSHLVGLWSDLEAKRGSAGQALDELQMLLGGEGGLTNSISAQSRSVPRHASSHSSSGNGGGNSLAKGAHASRLAFHQRWGHCPVCEKAGGCNHLWMRDDCASNTESWSPLSLNESLSECF
jgi:hypothetical protein